MKLIQKEGVCIKYFHHLTAVFVDFGWSNLKYCIMLTLFAGLKKEVALLNTSLTENDSSKGNGEIKVIFILVCGMDINIILYDSCKRIKFSNCI